MMCLVYKKLINKGVVFIKKVLKMLELIKVGTLMVLSYLCLCQLLSTDTFVSALFQKMLLKS